MFLVDSTSPRRWTPFVAHAAQRQLQGRQKKWHGELFISQIARRAARCRTFIRTEDFTPASKAVTELSIDGHKRLDRINDCRVGGGCYHAPPPHRPQRARLTHWVPPATVSLKRHRSSAKPKQKATENHAVQTACAPPSRQPSRLRRDNAFFQAHTTSLRNQLRRLLLPVMP